jgi:SRSO17 transposase
MEPEAQSREARFACHIDALAAVLGREDRARPLKDYCTGLLMPGKHKSVEPMAAVVAPARVSAKHQSLQCGGYGLSLCADVSIETRVKYVKFFRQKERSESRRLTQ